MTYRWTCGPLRGEADSPEQLMAIALECATRARFVAQDDTGAQVMCVDFDPRGKNRQVEVPIVAQHAKLAAELFTR